MKKCFNILAVVLLLSMITFHFCASAETQESLSINEAKETLSLALEIRESIGFRFIWFRDGKTYSDGLRNAPYKCFPPKDVIPRGYDYWCYVVKDGYDPESVKQKIRSVYASSYAEEIIEKDCDFFYYYFWDENEELWYYYYPMGAQSSRFHFESAQEFDLETPNSIRILSCENNKAVVRVHGHWNKYLYPNDVEVYSTPSFDVDFYFVYEAGKWKISGANYAQMILSISDDITLEGEFSKEIAKTAISGAIYDVYYYSAMGYGKLYTFGVGTKIIEKRIGIKKVGYLELEGNLSKLDFWKSYAGKFCTKEIADKLTQFGSISSLSSVFLYDNDTIYSRVGGGNCALDRCYDFVFDYLTDDNIAVEDIDNQHAKVSFTYDCLTSRGEKVSTKLTILFAKENGEWKISGGDFIDKLDEYYGYERQSNVNTGDNSAILFIVVTLLIALSVIKRKGLTIKSN